MGWEMDIMVIAMIWCLVDGLICLLVRMFLFLPRAEVEGGVEGEI